MTVEISYHRKIVNGRYHWTTTKGIVDGEVFEFMGKVSKKEFLKNVAYQRGLAMKDPFPGGSEVGR